MTRVAEKSNIAFIVVLILLAMPLGLYITGYFTATSSNYEASAEATALESEGVVSSQNYEAMVSGSVFGGEATSSNYKAIMGILPSSFLFNDTAQPEAGAPAGGHRVFYQASGGRVISILTYIKANVTLTLFEDTSINSINFIGNKSITSGVVEAKKLEASALPAAPPTEKIYELLNLTKLNIDDLSFLIVKIRFTVNKLLLSENSLEEWQIFVERLEQAGWKKLPTIKISDDSEKINYEADSPSLSFFAITALPSGETPPTSTTTSTTTTTSPRIAIIPGFEIEKPEIGVGFVALVIIIIVLVFFLYKKFGNKLFKQAKVK